jgi:cell division protein FtsZ
MGIGSARGEDRAVQAAETAISSPLLEASVDGAHGVLLSIQGGSDLGLFEINEAARLVQEAAHPEANIIFGAVIDDALGDEVRVTVIAAGFDGGAPTQRKNDRALGQVSGRTMPSSAPAASSASTSHHVVPPRVGQSAPVATAPVTASRYEDDEAVLVERDEKAPEPVVVPRSVDLTDGARATRSSRPILLDEEDLDVPDFLK